MARTIKRQQTVFGALLGAIEAIEAIEGRSRAARIVFHIVDDRTPYDLAAAWCSRQIYLKVKWSSSALATVISIA